MSVTYQKISPFPFYSLKQFTQLQPLRSTVYLYQHNSSKQIFAVKEIPYTLEAIKTYEIILKRQALEGIVRLRGMCLMVIKYSMKYKNSRRMPQLTNLDTLNNKLSSLENQSQVFALQNLKNRIEKKQYKYKEQCSLIIFMEKCECNMFELIHYRRKQKKPFHAQQVLNFINQTLLVLYLLQKDGLSQRDIKPENFLYDRGRFRICDFQNAICFDYLLQNQFNRQLDLTTLEYSSPQFYKNFKNTKAKLFDPFKLDVYSLGITILYMCSLGRFDLSERKQYLLEDSIYHTQFIKEQRRKILKNNDSYRGFNTIVKIMLEEDEYKRDTFITLMLKIQPIMTIKGIQAQQIGNNEVELDQSQPEENWRKITRKNKKSKKRSTNQWPGTSQKQRKYLFSLLIFVFSFYALILII